METLTNEQIDTISKLLDRSIFFDWKDWNYKYEKYGNELDNFIITALQKIYGNDVDYSNINYEQLYEIYLNFFKQFEYDENKLTKLRMIFDNQVRHNCVDKLFTSLYQKYINPEYKDSLLFFSKSPYCRTLKYREREQILMEKFGVIWNKYKNDQRILELFEKNDETETIKTIDENVVKNKFMSTDPTPNGIYYDWILRMFINGSIKLLDDLGKVKDAIMNTQILNESKKTGIEILSYNNFDKLLDKLDEYQDFFEKRRFDKKFIELAKKTTEQIYEDDEIRIVSPQTKEAAMYYGRRTRWCTAAKNNNMFDSYNKSGGLYIMLIKHPSVDYPDEKYQFEFRGREFMNEKDENVELGNLVEKYKGLKNFFRSNVKLLKNIVIFADQIEYLDSTNARFINYEMKQNYFHLFKNNYNRITIDGSTINNIDNIPICNSLILESQTDDPNINFDKFKNVRRSLTINNKNLTVFGEIKIESLSLGCIIKEDSKIRVKNLILMRNFEGILPKNTRTKELKIHNNYGVIDKYPRGLEKLELSTFSGNIEAINLPKNLISLKIGKNSRIDRYPDNLEKLDLLINKGNIDIPLNVRTLILRNNNNIIVLDNLNQIKNITNLYLINIISKNYPNQLKMLQLNYSNYGRLANTYEIKIPENINDLSIIYRSENIVINNLPLSIEKLYWKGVPGVLQTLIKPEHSFKLITTEKIDVSGTNISYLKDEDDFED
jgi:hypothetical protein